jgi:hypothetical protein
MRRLGFLVLSGAIGLASVTAVSCSNTVSKADFKKQLDDAGLGGAADTQCLVDKLEAAGFQFRTRGDLSQDEQNKISDAAAQCITIGGATATTG